RTRRSLVLRHVIVGVFVRVWRTCSPRSGCLRIVGPRSSCPRFGLLIRFLTHLPLLRFIAISLLVLSWLSLLRPLPFLLFFLLFLGCLDALFEKFQILFCLFV